MMSFLLCICLCLVSILGNYCCVSKYFFWTPKRNADVNFEIHFPKSLGSTNDFRNNFVFYVRTLYCQVEKSMPISSCGFCSSSFGNSFNIPVPNSSTSQMQSISRYDDFFSYFWPDDDIGKVKKSSLLCVAKALESLAFVFLCCTPISLAPS